MLVARRSEKLEELRSVLSTNVEIICMDLAISENCYSLFDRCKNKDVEVLVNNAGFGLFGEFCNTELDTELKMIDLNVKSLHILMKLFLMEFNKKNKGRILNVGRTLYKYVLRNQGVRSESHSRCCEGTEKGRK